jgi:alpha-L-rhamnosidase
LILLGLAALIIAVYLPAAETPGPQAPTGLRCEYLENPMGVDVKQPRFFWVLEHSGRGQAQSAYQMIVSSDPAAAAADIWDSGKVASARSTQVVYGGKALESGKSYFWKVKYWDKDGKESAWSDTARFETGLFERPEWKGGWIGGQNQLRKEFALDGRVKRARAYVCGLGYHELRVNGRKAGGHVLDPGWTT